jgi:phosphomevalonate kinase
LIEQIVKLNSNSAEFRVTAPANLLLFGEYAVTEERGLGITVAVDKRLAVTVIQGSDLQFFSNWDDDSSGVDKQLFQHFTTGSNRLVSSIVNECQFFLNTQKKTSVTISGYYYLDSSLFKTTDGRKSGLGSSAALSVALCAAIIYKHIPEGYSSCQFKEHVFTVALKAHRAAQNNRGSGYDVASSVYGSIGLFNGGLYPVWTKKEPGWLKSVSLIQGPQPVSSPKAVDCYIEWKKREATFADQFLLDNNRYVELLFKSSDLRVIQNSMNSLSELSIKLGDSIGVSARLPLSGESSGETVTYLNEIMEKTRSVTNNRGDHPFQIKAIGAGNELFAIINSPMKLDCSYVNECSISQDGVVIETFR